MIQTIRPDATFRDGQRGELGAPDANGFALFRSISGAVFTVHRLECVVDIDGMQYSPAVAAISGACALTIRLDADGAIVTFRTPTAAQCNAKRSARRVEQIGERT